MRRYLEANGRAAEYDRFAALMDQDSKDPALKELQGRMWEEGYRSGELAGEVFDDVVPALNRWQRQGVGVGVFSSGSVLAQKLLFRHSKAGDLTPFIRWHFDTAVGAKTDAGSYARIAASMGILPANVTFVSDVVRELDAARAAGMRTALSLRPGNPVQPDPNGHPAISNFDELLRG
jgi:enolase-phosphatase E1